MTPRTRSALADLASLADAAEAADLMLMAHGIRRAARDIEADLAPVVVEQEDDGDPEVPGERIDPAVFGKRADDRPETLRTTGLSTGLCQCQLCRMRRAGLPL